MILIIIMVTIQVDGGIDDGGGRPRWPWEREGDWDWDRRGRQRMNLQWDQPVGRSQCLAYGSREYTARLWNIPTGYSWMKACENTTVEINGITFSKPDFCEDKGIWGVYGHWIIHTGEMTCQPYWGSFLDEGCVVEGSHLHRVRSRLWNIESGNDWMKMCSTTPATLHDQHFTRPTYCEDQGILGIYGIWDYKDYGC
ncbi:hypothetical protein BD779DRAFT_399832 [Infundibulicybe gibba]|nr:hypothetical protein BD779DRAFT_399832 [Infundibulicybe gibba]